MQPGLKFFGREGKRFFVFRDSRIQVTGAFQCLAAKIVTYPIGWVEVLGLFELCNGSEEVLLEEQDSARVHVGWRKRVVELFGLTILAERFVVIVHGLARPAKACVRKWSGRIELRRDAVLLFCFLISANLIKGDAQGLMTHLEVGRQRGEFA